MADAGRAGWLARILDQKRREIPELREAALPSPPPIRPVELRRPPGTPLHLLAEIKLRSPSAGALSRRLGVGERAAAYARAGARVVSVLTDRQFFDGSYAHLTEAKHASPLPVLCKDFVLDESQLDAARAYGADAVLLIVRCLPAERVPELVNAARERGLEPLVEVVTEAEAELAVDAGAGLIGVNARDLDTLEMDPRRAERMLEGLPRDVVGIHLSGLAAPDDVARVARSPAGAALVGEALMRADDPEPLLRSLCAAAGSAAPDAGEA